MPKYYPMMMDLRGRKCVVVGGGEVAARKVESLLDCGAVVTVVAPKAGPEIAAWAKDGKITHLNGEFFPECLEGAALAIASTDVEKVNRAVYGAAAAKNIPVNVVDVPELCTFIVPSIVERGDLVLAISTSGKSPAMAKRIRKEMQGHFGEEYGVMLELMGELRGLVQAREPNLENRMRLLSEIANSNLLDRIRNGERPSAEAVLKEASK